MPPVIQESFSENLRECDFCGKLSEKGRWVFPRESSLRGVSHTTFTSSRQVPRIRNQEKKWQCEDHFKKLRNPTLKDNLDFLSKNPLSSAFQGVNQKYSDISSNVSTIQGDLSATTALFQDLNNQFSGFQKETKEIAENFQTQLSQTNENIKKTQQELKEKTDHHYQKEGIDKLITEEKEEELKKKKAELLDLDRTKWRRELRKHEKEWVNEAESPEELEKVEEKLTEVTKWNIYDCDGVEHLFGWPAFLALVGSAIHWVRKESAKEISSEDFLDDITDKFAKWRLNLWSSVGVYVVLFFLSQQAINKWGYLVSLSMAKSEFLTVLGVGILLGFLYIADNFITSILKTPLQRLGVKIENSPLQEKTKKKLLSKTQEANESFKETFKKFGIVALTPLLVSLVGKKIWDANLIANVCFFVPIGYAGWRIREVNKILKRVKKSKIKLD